MSLMTPALAGRFFTTSAIGEALHNTPFFILIIFHTTANTPVQGLLKHDFKKLIPYGDYSLFLEIANFQTYGVILYFRKYIFSIRTTEASIENTFLNHKKEATFHYFVKENSCIS